MNHLGRAPRVLVSGVVLDQPMGGVWRHNLELLPRVARLLREAGGDLAVLVGKGGLACDLPPEIERIPSGVPSRPLLVRAAREGRALNDAARAGSFDLVHVAHLPAPRRLDVPTTITLHDLRALDLPHTPFSRRLVAKAVIGRALRDARGVFAVSEWMAERLRAGWPDVAARVSVVPNAGDHFEPLDVPAEARRAPGAPLLHLGHLEPRKNLDVVLRALALDVELPDLVLAGRARDGEEKRLRALASELQVGLRVRFHGPYAETELPGLLAACAAVVLPSRLEGFGIVALEALRARAPLAVSTGGALPEVAGPGVRTFDPDDPAACARAILAAIEAGASPENAARYSWDASAERWAAGWTRTLERPTS